MLGRLKHISVTQAGFVSLVWSFISSLIISVIMIFAGLVDKKSFSEILIGTLTIIFGYTILGFLGGIIGSFIYNLVAKLTGGYEAEFTPINKDLP